jgi:hypothetical protein
MRPFYEMSAKQQAQHVVNQLEKVAAMGESLIRENLEKRLRRSQQTISQQTIAQGEKDHG